MWELDCEESWAPKNWCFWTVVLEKTLESPLDCKEIQPVHPKGNQSWIFFGRTDAKAETPILWPPHVKSWLIANDSDAGRDWGPKKKGTTEDKMSGWHHQLNGHEFEWTLGVGDGQGGLACCKLWGCRRQTWLSDWTQLNWSNAEERTFVLFFSLRIPDPQSPLWKPQTPFSSLGTLNFLPVCLGIVSLGYMKRCWCWAKLKLGGEGDNRGWDGWTAFLTGQMWVWASSGSWWWTRKPGMLQSVGSQTIRHDRTTELINWLIQKLS